MNFEYVHMCLADVVKLVYTAVLDTVAEMRESSSLSVRNQHKIIILMELRRGYLLTHTFGMPPMRSILPPGFLWYNYFTG